MIKTAFDGKKYKVPTKLTAHYKKLLKNAIKTAFKNSDTLDEFKLLALVDNLN